MMLIERGQSILNTGASQFINELADLMKILAEATTQLEAHIETLSPSDPSTKYTGTEGDITRALEALHEGLTGHTSILLEELRKKTGLEDLIFAIKLVEAYLQQTSSLEKRLSALSAFDGGQHLRADVWTPSGFPCSKDDLYQFVPCVRKLLATTLNDILQELNLTTTEVDIESLLKESQQIYESVKKLNDRKQYPSPIDSDKVTPVVKQFINPHLTNAKNTFKKLGEQDITLSSNDIRDIGKLVTVWTDITDILNEITQKEDLSEANDSRQAIALSLQIDDSLEAIYSDIADIFREQDLLTPGIL